MNPFSSGVPGWNSAAPTWRPEVYRRYLYAHPGSQHLRWWKAIPSSDYDPHRGQRASSDPTANIAAYNYVEQTIPQRMALAYDVDLRTIYSSQGKLVDGDQYLVSMQDELPVGPYDLVALLGKFPGESRTYIHKVTLIRANVLIPQTGTISSSGTTVTGTGTSFQSTLQVGDLIVPSSYPVASALKVIAIASNTSLTLSGTPTPAWTGMNWSKGVDVLPRGLLASFDTVQTDSTVYPTSAYKAGTVTIGSQSYDTVQWTDPTNSPGPGARYGVIYRYFPKWMVLPDIGMPGPIVNTRPMPQRVVMRLYQPETLAF